MEVDALAHPSAEPAAQPPARTHAQAPDGGENQATAPFWENLTGPSPRALGRHEQARTSMDKQVKEILQLERFLCACASVHKTRS